MVGIVVVTRAALLIARRASTSIRLQSFWLDSFHGFLSPEGWTISKSWKMSARYGLLQISPKPWRLTQILFASTELPELLQNHHLWMC